MPKLPENIQKWIDALRSGEYKQVKGTLKGKMEDVGVGFCCLGVYCQINGRGVRTETPDISGKYGHEGSSKHYDWLRKEIDCYVIEKGIEMNDEGESFEEIADMIEISYKRFNQQ